MAIDIHRLWARFQTTAEVRLRLYRKIEKMLVNGLPLLKVLEELEMRASDRGRKPNEPEAILLGEWRRTVQNGGALHEGMADWVPQQEQMIIMAGEQSGRVEVALRAVTSVVASGRKIRNAILAGLAYPLALLAMTVAYLYLFGLYVIPQFGMIAPPDQWHGSARWLYLMSHFVRIWLIWCLLLASFLAAGLVYALPRWRGRFRNLLDNIPPFSIYRMMVGTSFLTAFASLQTAGFTVEKSLLRLTEQAKPWLAQRIDDMLFGVKSGLNVGEAMKNTGYHFPSREIVDDLCIYAEYNGFADALKTIADEWMEAGVERVGVQMRVFNGAAILILAILLGVLVTGFFGIQHEIAAMTRTMR